MGFSISGTYASQLEASPVGALNEIFLALPGHTALSDQLPKDARLAFIARQNMALLAHHRTLHTAGCLGSLHLPVTRSSAFSCHRAAWPRQCSPNHRMKLELSHPRAWAFEIGRPIVAARPGLGTPHQDLHVSLCRRFHYDRGLSPSHYGLSSSSNSLHC